MLAAKIEGGPVRGKGMLRRGLRRSDTRTSARRLCAVVVRGCMVAIALAAVASGCGGGSTSTTTATDSAATTTHTTPVDPAVRARLMRDGATVFAQHCATCHPLLGKPNKRYHEDAPPLPLDEVQPEPAYVSQRLASGGVGMGGFQGVLSTRATRAVTAYMLAVTGRKVVVPKNPSAAVLAKGASVFAQHCQFCHGIAGRAATRRTPTIWIGTDLGQVRPSVAFTERLVRTGEHQAMPSFRHRLSAAEIHAVAIYTTVNAGPRAASSAPDR